MSIFSVGFGRFSFIPPSCLLGFRKNSDTSFIRDTRVSALMTFKFFNCLMCIYFLLVSLFVIYFKCLLVKTYALTFYVPYVFVCFYLSYINHITSCIFRFSNEEEKQILRLRLIMKNNVRYVEALKCIERLKELQRSSQQIIASFFSFFCVPTRRFLVGSRH